MDSLKKILIISDAWHPQVNGVVRTYEHVIEELESTGHDVKVIGPQDFKFTLPMPGYSEIKLALFPYRRLKKLIKTYAPDGIHIATEGPLGWAARRYCVKHDIGYTTAYHTHFPDYIAARIGKALPFLKSSAKTFGIWYIHKFHNPSKGMLVATKSLEHDLERWNFTVPRYSFSRGVNFAIFNPDGPTNPIKSKLKAPVSLYVGRIAIEKNLESFLSMPWDGSKLIVGEGPARKKLENKYPDAFFVGAHSGQDLAAYYRAGDVFIFPSKTDTFGMVLIEAMSCGLPIAGYDVTGPKDIITDDFLGAIDTKLVNAAQSALNATGTAQKRHQYVKENYSWSHAAYEFMHALKDATA